MSAKHTPGPWAHYDDSQDGKTHRHEIVAMGKTICHIYHSIPKEDAANARLIAAAPTLLAALQNCVDFWPSALNDDLQERTWNEASELLESLGRIETAL